MATTLQTIVAVIIIAITSLTIPMMAETWTFELKMRQPSGDPVTKTVEMEADRLRSLGLKSEDMAGAEALVDTAGRLSELLVGGRRLPLVTRKRVKTRNVYEYVNSDNRTIHVTRDFFANMSLQDMHGDPTLKPEPVTVDWGEQPSTNPFSRRPLPVEFHSNRSQAVITAGGGIGTVLKIKFSQDLISQGTVMTMASPMGIHLRVMSPRTGQLVLTAVALATQPLAVRELVNRLTLVRPGLLVIVTTLVDGTLSLSDSERRSLEALGSRMVGSLRFQDLWTWVWVSGGATLLESVTHGTAPAPPSYMPQLAPPLHAHIEVSLPREEGVWCPEWPPGPASTQRRVFCDAHAGYGKLCQCHHPYRASDATPKKYKERLAVLVLTRNRPHYLFRLLSDLLHQPGVRLLDLLVVVDGSDSQETLRLLDLLKVAVLVHAPEGKTPNSKISRNLRFALFSAMQHFPATVSKYIVLEDDLILSPDFYDYMQQTAVLLDRDPTVYAVSAYNAHAFTHTSRNASRLYRDDGFPSCGWMVARPFVEEVLPMWPNALARSDWDFWLGDGLARLDRSVVLPEVPRVKHGGVSGGVHVTGTEVALLLQEKPITKGGHVELDIESVMDEAYEREAQSLLSRALPLNFSHELVLPREGPGDVYLVYILKPETGHSVAFRSLAHVMGIWCRDSRGSRHGLWRFPFYNTTLLLLAVPSQHYKEYVRKGYGAVQAVETTLPNMKAAMTENERSAYTFSYHFPEYRHYNAILFGG